MADKKISALTGASTPLAGTEVLPVVQGGATVKVAVSNLTAGRQVGMSSYNMGITAFTPTAAGTISDGTDNTAAEKITELLVVSDDNSWKTSGASFAAYRTYLSVSGATIYVSNGAARYRSVNFTPEGNIALATAAKGIDFSANPSAAGMTSELLNDYEEGTWTPTDASGAGLVITITATTTPTYVKIGRLVVCSADVTYPVTANASTARLSLPFAGAAALPSGGGMVGFKSDGIAVFGSVGTTGSTFLSPVNTFLTNANLSGVRFQMTWTFQV